MKLLIFGVCCDYVCQQLMVKNILRAIEIFGYLFMISNWLWYLCVIAAVLCTIWSQVGCDLIKILQCSVKCMRWCHSQQIENLYFKN